jgi:hypothetical protein
MQSRDRVVALSVLIAAFTPAAVLGTLPVVLPVVLLSLLLGAVIRGPGT